MLTKFPAWKLQAALGAMTHSQVDMEAVKETTKAAFASQKLEEVCARTIAAKSGGVVEVARRSDPSSGIQERFGSRVRPSTAAASGTASRTKKEN